MISLFLSFFASAYPVKGQTQGFTLPCQIQTYGNAWDGLITFGLWNMSSTPFAAVVNNSYLVVMKTDGALQFIRKSNDSSYLVEKNIAPDTLMFQGEPIATTNFLNLTSNVTVNFPNVYGHHDVEYNPINNTFLTLRNNVYTVNGNQVLFDQIVELDASGNVLWTWDTYDHLPLSQADPFNLTTVSSGQTVIDFTHCNSIQWFYNESVVYLNVRHTNTFYKINMTTGNVIWACGQFGNFTLLDANGNSVNNLWYHSHSTRMVAPDVFTMFDNDFDNLTNPNDCHGRMIELTLNETTMTAWVSWSWEAPTQYWSPYFGINNRLPNGDHLGLFGTPTHHFQQNQPWVGNDTGAVMVEVNSAGNVVRTWTFSPGWGIYRVELVNNLSGVTVIPEFGGFAALLFPVVTAVAVPIIALGQRLLRKRLLV
jgi:hypothetical protein